MESLLWTEKIHIDYFLNRGIIVPGDIALGQEVVMYKILDNVSKGVTTSSVYIDFSFS